MEKYAAKNAAKNMASPATNSTMPMTGLLVHAVGRSRLTGQLGSAHADPPLVCR